MDWVVVRLFVVSMMILCWCGIWNWCILWKFVMWLILVLVWVLEVNSRFVCRCIVM